MKAIAIFFSPTRSTESYAKKVAEGLSDQVEFIDITTPGKRKEAISLGNGPVLIGFPVYGMRIPKPVLEFLSTLQGKGNPMAVIAVYGNIDSGIVLKQARKIALRQNLTLIGAGCFVARHIYSTDVFPVAADRPDNNDLQYALQFGELLRKKIESGLFTMPAIKTNLIPTIIEKAPYGGTKVIMRQPKADSELCNKCLRCYRTCPSGAITRSLEIVESKCLRCLACVKNCPTGARKSGLKKTWMERILFNLGKKPKQNHIFL